MAVRSDKLTEREHMVLTEIMFGRLDRLMHLPEESPQGIHQTAASLVRKGFVRRVSKRPVEYQITSEGRAWLGWNHR